jgi:hypothetical protein
MKDELGPAWEERVAKHADGTPVEAFGTPMSEQLVQQMRAIDLTAVRADAEQITIVSTKPNERLRTSLPDARWIELGESAAWNSDAALNAMIVPMDAVQAVVSQLEKNQ